MQRPRCLFLLKYLVLTEIKEISLGAEREAVSPTSSNTQEVCDSYLCCCWSNYCYHLPSAWGFQQEDNKQHR